MSWTNAIFGFWGLPLMIAFGGGIIFGFQTLIVGMSVWGLMFGYSFIKFSEESEGVKK